MAQITCPDGGEHDWVTVDFPTRECVGCLATDQNADEPEPDYDYEPYEQSRSYREAVIGAGRGHLLR